jgi:hypothetical protein
MPPASRADGRRASGASSGLAKLAGGRMSRMASPRFQFSIRSLLVFTGWVAVACVALPVVLPMWPDLAKQYGPKPEIDFGGLPPGSQAPRAVEWTTPKPLQETDVPNRIEKELKGGID